MVLRHGGKGGVKAEASAAGAAGKRPDARDSQSGDESGERSDPENMVWTKDTDLVLRDLVLRSGEVNWGKIATAIEWDAGTVTARECEDRCVIFCFVFRDGYYSLQKIRIHSVCEIEDLVETHLCKTCVILRSRVLRVVCPHSGYIGQRLPLELLVPCTRINRAMSISMHGNYTSRFGGGQNPTAVDRMY